jgi:hypothetical protein
VVSCCCMIMLRHTQRQLYIWNRERLSRCGYFLVSEQYASTDNENALNKIN